MKPNQASNTSHKQQPLYPIIMSARNATKYYKNWNEENAQGNKEVQCSSIIQFTQSQPSPLY
jgi:hypothetical protein